MTNTLVFLVPFCLSDEFEASNWGEVIVICILSFAEDVSFPCCISCQGVSIPYPNLKQLETKNLSIQRGEVISPAPAFSPGYDQMLQAIERKRLNIRLETLSRTRGGSGKCFNDASMWGESKIRSLIKHVPTYGYLWVMFNDWRESNSQQCRHAMVFASNMWLFFSLVEMTNSNFWNGSKTPTSWFLQAQFGLKGIQWNMQVCPLFHFQPPPNGDKPNKRRQNSA